MMKGTTTRVVPHEVILKLYYNRSPGEPSEPYRDISAGIFEYMKGDNSKIIEHGDGRGPVLGIKDLKGYRKISIQNISAVTLWSQACIDVDYYTLDWEYLKFNPKDKGPPPIERDVLYTGTFDLIFGPGVIGECLVDSLQGENDVVHVFLVGTFSRFGRKRPDVGGCARYSNTEFWPYNFDAFFLRSHLSRSGNTVAHELGHILSREPDINNPKWILFPQKPCGESNSVNRYRRFTKRTIDRTGSNTTLLKNY